MSDVSYHPIVSVFHPSDFSESSELAFDHALRIALSNQSFFDVLHVDSPKTDNLEGPSFPKVRETLERWGLLEKGSARQAVADELGLKVRKVELYSSNPLAIISEFLDDQPADLIVLATQGREGLPRWLKPSVSESLARRSKTVTLFVPDGARGFVSQDSGEVRLERVLIPIDQKPDPQIAIDVAAAFLWSLDAKAPKIEALYVGEGDSLPTVAAPSFLDGSLQSTARTGEPVDEILRAAEEDKADLIVMATEGHHGFLDALRGSTTEQVLRQAPCPVMAIPVTADLQGP